MAETKSAFANTASALLLAFGMNAANAQEAPTPPASAPVASALAASAPSAPVTAKAAVELKPTFVQCDASAQNFGGSFMAGLVKYLVSKSRIEGAGDVAGQYTEFRIKTDQPECSRIGATALATKPPTP